MMKILMTISLLLCLLSCQNKKSEGNGEEADSTTTTNFEENDHLSLQQVPESIKEWLDFYGSIDTTFTINNFLSSGVSIHIDSLPRSIGQTDENIYKPFLAYSPDSTRYIDFLSYNQFIEKDTKGNLTVATGDPDQETKLVDKKSKSSKQLMYYGPSQAVESAAWLSNDAFLLGIMSLDSTKQWVPEIYLFNLKDSTFTNFRLKKTLSADSLVLKDKNYMDAYFRKRNVEPD